MPDGRRSMLAYIKLYGLKNSCNELCNVGVDILFMILKRSKTISNWFELNIL